MISEKESRAMEIPQLDYPVPPYGNRTALEEITEMAHGAKLCREVVQALVSHNRRDKPHFGDCRVSTEVRGGPPPDSLYGVIVNENPPSSEEQRARL